MTTGGAYWVTGDTHPRVAGTCRRSPPEPTAPLGDRREHVIGRSEGPVQLGPLARPSWLRLGFPATRRIVSAIGTPASTSALAARAEPPRRPSGPRDRWPAIPAARVRAGSSDTMSVSGCTVSIQNRRSASRCAVPSVISRRLKRRRYAVAREHGVLDGAASPSPSPTPGRRRAAPVPNPAAAPMPYLWPRPPRLRPLGCVPMLAPRECRRSHPCAGQRLTAASTRRTSRPASSMATERRP